MASDLVAAFLIGMAGSVHCVGMCGGIVGSLTFLLPKSQNHWPYHLAYNTGRIGSYALAGAITGAIGQIFVSQLSTGLAWLQLLSACFLLLLALYIGDIWRVLSHFEQAGRYLWQYLQPLSKRFLPLSSPLQALPYGMIWGWLPCGLVYSTLTWSVASGSVNQGALIMLFFGLGTLPALITLGLGVNSMRTLLAKPIARKIIAFILAVSSLLLIYRALINL